MLKSIAMLIARYVHKRWFWNHQLPEAIVIQPVRKVGKTAVKLDIRNFFVNPKVWELQEVLDGIFTFPPFPSIRIGDLKEWVRLNIIAKPESKGADFWQLPFETLILKEGDCEDQAILLANLLRAATVEDWKVRLNAGMTSQGPHVWLTYFNGESWEILDPVLQGAKYGEVWFSWTANHAFSTKENIEKWQVS